MNSRVFEHIGSSAVGKMGRNAVSTVYLSVLAFMLCEVSCGDEYYTNQWAVHVEGGEHVARHLAEKHGFTFVDKVQMLLLLSTELFIAEKYLVL